MQKTYSTAAARAECMCEIIKENAKWNFSNLENFLFLTLCKIYSAEFFLIFSILLLCVTNTLGFFFKLSG